MSLEIEQYERKSFPVQAVRVTAENMADVAEWCGGALESEDNDRGKDQGYVRVRVEHPLSDRQTKAFPGDWVLFAHGGYKVYRDKPFRSSFDKKAAFPVEPVEVAAEHNVFAGEGNHVIGPSSSAQANPGGAHG